MSYLMPFITPSELLFVDCFVIKLTFFTIEKHWENDSSVLSVFRSWKKLNDNTQNVTMIIPLRNKFIIILIFISYVRNLNKKNDLHRDIPYDWKLQKVLQLHISDQNDFCIHIKKLLEVHYLSGKETLCNVHDFVVTTRFR